MANSLWGQEGADIQSEFLDLVTRYFAGHMRLLDFQGAPEPARKTINKWVEDKTANRIKDLIPADGLSADTRLVLVNAVYFKGAWASPFKKSRAARIRRQP